MKNFGKRALSMLCALTMLLSLMAMIVPGAFADSTTTNEIDAIPSEHLAAVRYYSDFATEAGKTAYVDDSDAYGGKAVCYSKANFDGGDFISIHRYESATSADASIAQLFKADLNVNQGYHIYKFSYDVPAETTENGVVYIMPNWQLNSSQLCKDIYAYAGQTVELYFSMKVTGPDADGLYSVFVDRVAIADLCKDNLSADGMTCGKCGNVIGTQAELELIAMQNAGQVYADYRASVSQDLDGAGGKETDDDAMDQTTVKAGPYNLSATGFRFYAYSNANGNILLDSVAPGQLKIDEGYQLYKLSMAIPDTLADAACTYGISDGDWRFVSFNAKSAVQAFVGKQMDVYISLKITGSLEQATCYIDRMVFVDSCMNYMDEDGFCTKCGKPLDITFLADDITLAMPDFDTKVADPDSIYGVATKLSAEDRAGDSWLYNMMFYSGGKTLPFYVTDNTVHKQAGAISDVQLLANAAAGRYVTYKFSKLDMSGMAFMYTFDWTVRTNFTAEQMSLMQGKKMDMTVSMKVTGDVTGADTSNPPVYYIDCIRYTVYQEDLIDQIPSEHAKSVRDYSGFNNDPAQNTNHVNDIEAYGGMAACHITDNPKMTIYRYDVDSGLGDGSPALNIGNLTAEELKINQGYQVYKFIYDVPAETTAGNTFYIMPNWQLNNAAFCADFAPYAGQTVEVYLSIKVTEADGLYSVYVDRVALATICSWDNGVVTVQPTYESEGVMTYTCLMCGATKTESVDKLVEPTPAESWGLVLGDSIGMNFVLDLTEEQILAGALVEVSAAGQENFYLADELVDESGKAVLNLNLAAAQMTEEVKIILYVGEEKISKTYTVRQYADYILDEANGYDDATKNMVKHMLSYGAAAQNYFGIHTDDLADAGITVEAAAVPTEGGSMDVTGGVAGVGFYGASLVHKNKIAVRFYFIADSLEDINFGDHEAVPKGDKYCVEVANINPQDMDADITVTVSDGTNTLSVSYAPMDYIIRMYNKESSAESTKTLIQALYGYYLAAKAYTTAV